MRGLYRRRRGIEILLHAHSYLTMNGMSLQDSAPQLLWNLWLADGNFYRNHKEFPMWAYRLDRWINYSVRYRLPYRLRLAYCCLVGRDIEWVHEDCE